MVKINESRDESRDLDALVEEVAEKTGLKLYVNGWTRKTYDLHALDPRTRKSRLLLRLESFATRSGEILLFDDEGLPAATLLGEALERDFGVAEATIVRRAPDEA